MCSCFLLFVIVMLCGGETSQQPPPPNITTCEEFERRAQFNPYAVISSMWKIFYFWGKNTELTPIVFELPHKKRLAKYKENLEAIEPSLAEHIEWNKAVLFMNPKFGTEVLFISGGSPGAFRAIIKVENRSKKVRPFPPPRMKLADVRLKIVDGVLGMMCCEDYTAYAMKQMDRMPETEKECVSQAKLLGFHRDNGLSYLALRKKIQDEL